MRSGKVFSLTLILFLMVWGFCAIDYHHVTRKKFTIDELRLEHQMAVVTLDPSVQPDASLSDNAVVNEQLQEIDRQIKELESMKRGFEARALRHDDQAQRLQFEDRAVLETRRHIELAEENRQKAQRVQEEIDRLQAAKVKLAPNQ